MPTNNLTLRGTAPDPRTLEHLVAYDSTEELGRRIATLFTPEGYVGMMFKNGFYFKYDNQWGQEALLDCLKGLPVDHEIVQEILHRANLILEEVPKMSAAQLYALAPGKEVRSCEIALGNVFDIGDIISPKAIFSNLQKASYHLLNEHLAHPTELPDEVLTSASIRGMLGYRESRPQELLAFASFLDQNQMATAYMIRCYADLGNTRAITAFIEALEQNKPHLDYKVLGRNIKRILTDEHHFSPGYFKERADTIADERVKRKFKEYLKIE